MDTLNFREPPEVTRDYDEEADVLYVSFGEPVPSLTLDIGSGVLVHYVEESGELTGFTVLFASTYAGGKPVGANKKAGADRARLRKARV